MAKFGKLIGAGLGWAFGGPLGALFGVAIGAMFDKMDAGDFAVDGSGNRTGQTTSQQDFNRSLVVLSAAVMNADGRVLVSELDFVRQYFARYFGAEKAAEYILVLREILKSDIPLQDVCTQIGRNMDNPSKLQILHYLFGIAQADGSIDPSELSTIRSIANWMLIHPYDYKSIESMFINGGSRSQNGKARTQNSPRDYEILEIEPDATEKEIKKAYRSMAKKHHPDLVAHLGPEHVKAAKEKFQSIQEAYDRICAHRNIN